MSKRLINLYSVELWLKLPVFRMTDLAIFAGNRVPLLKQQRSNRNGPSIFVGQPSDALWPLAQHAAANSLQRSSVKLARGYGARSLLRNGYRGGLGR